MEQLCNHCQSNSGVATVASINFVSFDIPRSMAAAIMYAARSLPPPGLLPSSFNKVLHSCFVPS
jgi:hypothetical protein